MKIGNPAAPGVAGGRSVERTGKSEANGPKAAAATSGDKVALSDVAQSLAALATGDLGEVTPTDPARLEALREAVRNGTLDLDPRAIAEAIVTEELGER